MHILLLIRVYFIKKIDTYRRNTLDEMSVEIFYALFRVVPTTAAGLQYAAALCCNSTTANAVESIIIIFIKTHFKNE